MFNLVKYSSFGSLRLYACTRPRKRLDPILSCHITSLFFTLGETRHIFAAFTSYYRCNIFVLFCYFATLILFTARYAPQLDSSHTYRLPNVLFPYFPLRKHTCNKFPSWICTKTPSPVTRRKRAALQPAHIITVNSS